MGNFDGLHLGHQAVIGAAAASARESGASAGVVMFHPHPRAFFGAKKEFRRLTSLRMMAALLKDWGVDHLALLRFRRLASMTARDFVGEVLRDGLRAKRIYVGENFRFGKDRQGSAALLKEWAKEDGIAAHIVKTAGDGARTYSSTRLREALGAGRMEEAAKILGRDWALEGIVRRGDERGRAMGFPTANLKAAGHFLPAFGVYAARVSRAPWDGSRSHRAVVNIGIRPSFGGGAPLAEAHLLDCAENLYGERLIVFLLRRIREERRFDGLEALKDQIARDCEEARHLFSESLSETL